MLLEVIGVNVQDVKDAEQYGADRIELCSGMSESGLTPSYALIKQAVNAGSIPINVMVRPHGNSFVYSDADLAIMCEDIKVIKELGANGIVIGPITEVGEVDEVALQQLLNVANGLEVTFHRAFDYTNDQKKALQTILRYPQITTILSAGGPGSALEAVESLKELQEVAAGSHVTIMPGSGLQVETLQAFYDQLKPEAVHFGSGVRKDKSYAKRLYKPNIESIKAVGE